MEMENWLYVLTVLVPLSRGYSQLPFASIRHCHCLDHLIQDHCKYSFIQIVISMSRYYIWCDVKTDLYKNRTLSLSNREGCNRACPCAVHGWWADELHSPVGGWSVVSCMIMSIKPPLTIGKQVHTQGKSHDSKVLNITLLHMHLYTSSSLTSPSVKSISFSLPESLSVFINSASASIYRHPWPLSLATSLAVQVNKADTTGTVSDLVPPPPVWRKRKGKLLSWPIELLKVDLTSLTTSSSVISEWSRILPQRPLACSAVRALPFGIGITLLFPHAPYPWGKQTMLLSQVTRRGAFSFPFLCEKGLLLPARPDGKFWEASVAGSGLEWLLGVIDTVDGRDGRLAWGMDCEPDETGNRFALCVPYTHTNKWLFEHDCDRVELHLQPTYPPLIASYS